MGQTPDIHAPDAGSKTSTSDIKVVTLGCRLNAYESDVIASHAKDAEIGKTVIINSCAVTNAAVADTRRAVRKAKRENPDARIIVTGCAAQIDPSSFAAMPEVDNVLGNAEKMLPGAYDLRLLSERVRVNDIQSVTETAPQFLGDAIAGGSNRAPERIQSRTRAFLQVQNGCDHRCTFCIIPFGRGRARSVPAGEVVGAVKRLVDEGHKEVVLTGVDISSWGQDLPGTPPLGDLVRRVLTLVPDLPRLRLSSIDPAEIDPALFAAVTTHPRMMPYLHLSLQSGDNMILKRMKRRHTREDVIELCARLRAARPDITFGADIIAGFPTETDAMFENSRAIISEIGIAWLHVFPYSPREGTPAAKMPPVDGSVTKARAKLLRDAGDAAQRAHLTARTHTQDTALFEDSGLGRLPDFTLVKVDNPPAAGTFCPVEIMTVDGPYASAKVLNVG